MHTDLLIHGEHPLILLPSYLPWGLPTITAATWIAVPLGVTVSRSTVPFFLVTTITAVRPRVHTATFVAVLILSTSSVIWFPRRSIVVMARIPIAVHAIIIAIVSSLSSIHTSSVGSSWVRRWHTTTASITTFGRACPWFTVAMPPVSTSGELLTYYCSLLLCFDWSGWCGLGHFKLGWLLLWIRFRVL